MIFLGCCSKDGRYGLFSPSRGGLDLLDLKYGNVVRTLIPKVAEGIFNVIAQFNETDEYVLYYHSGKKTLRVFRVLDGVMIANYRVPSNLTAMESTSDGNNVALGMVDGNLSVLTIADPKKSRMKKYLRSLPSRHGLQAIISHNIKNGGPKMSHLVKTVQAVTDFANEMSAVIPQKEQEGSDTSGSEDENEDATTDGDQQGKDAVLLEAERLLGSAPTTPTKRHVSIREEEN